MTTLPNAKHERFAQALADGKTQLEAYAEAGYTPSRSNAGVLARQKHISARIAEVLSEREKIHAKGTAKAIERTALDKTWIIERLIDNAKAAHAAEDFGPSNRALELLGKEMGMFIDKHEVRTGELDEMKPDDLRDLRATVAAERARRAGSEDRGGPGAEQAGELPALH